MRVLIVSANTEQINMQTLPLGAWLVTGATRAAGHQVQFLDLMHAVEPAQQLQQEIASFQPEVIGVSIRNIDNQSRQESVFLLEKVRPLIQTIRDSSDAWLVLGGAGYSVFPDEALAYLGADLGIRGDGEVALPRLLERLARGKSPADLPGVHLPGVKVAPKPAWLPLAGSAGPSPDLWAAIDPAKGELWLPIQSRRGCPNNCSYCSTAAIQGSKVRARPAAEVIAELARYKEKGFCHFYFVDNTFNVPAAYALELCQQLRGLGVTWRCILYPHNLSEELVRAMAAAGCVEVALGFESGCARVLQALNKHFSPAEVRRSAELLAAQGIRCFGFLLLGGPGETRESVEESLAFADSLPLDGLRTTIGLRIYPGTLLARRALVEGQLAPGDNLLRPRFYLAAGLDPWIYERTASR